jgi:probable rRNA maturation factor
MKIAIDLQNEPSFADVPDINKIQHWLDTASQCLPANKNLNKHQLTIRLIDNEESAHLNETYRHKKGPTNVLSFPDENIPGFESDSFGDLAICMPIVIEEANAQNKTFEAHFAHLIIHGFLHLLGYDHEVETQAEIMESLEIEILCQLGFANPYKM